MNREEVKTSANLFPVHSYFLLQIRGFSSAGRAPALQAGGQRFDPANLHQTSLQLERLTEAPTKVEASLSLLKKKLTMYLEN